MAFFVSFSNWGLGEKKKIKTPQKKNFSFDFFLNLVAFWKIFKLGRGGK